jgi:hypothetical protein
MDLKGMVAGLFDKEVRNQRAFEKLVGQLVSKNRQHEERMACIENLATMNSARAHTALFRRWDMQADKAREDAAEKQYLAEVLVAKGERIVPFIREHNDRSINITWPIQVLQQVSNAEAVVEELLRILEAELERIASFKPEKKVRALQLLADFDDPRIGALALRSLEDFDPNVRFESLQLLAKDSSTQTRDAMIDRLNHADEDSGRIRETILHALADGEFKVTDRKADLEAHFGDQWRIGPKNNLVPAD